MFYASKLMTKHGVQTVFSHRVGGFSPQPFDSLNLGLELGDDEANVAKNLNLLLEKTGFPMPHQIKQVHGIQIKTCEGVGDIHGEDGDILLAQTKGVALAVRTADCVPILLADPQHQVVAAVHAGWKGTTLEVVKKAVQAMALLGTNPLHILASIGPSIGECCFESNTDIAQKLEVSCGATVSKQVQGKTYSNLAQCNQLQLLNMGLKAENIELSDHCTACHAHPSYFSYRRDKGRTGRQLSMIMMA